MAQNYDPKLPASGQTTFGELYQILRDKFEALRSSFSGTSFPLNPVAGQVCYRTDIKKWYIYSNDVTLGDNGWVEIVIDTPESIFNQKFEQLRSSFASTSFPLDAVTGQVCYRTDRKRWYIYTNDPSVGDNGWVEIAINAFGSIGEEVVTARGTKSSLDERLDVSLNEDGTLKANVAAYQSEWIKPSLTFSYVDSSHFNVEGNQTDIYVYGRRLKINHSTSPTGYTSVYSSSYDATNNVTTVTVFDPVIASDLVSVEHGFITSDATRTSLPMNLLYSDVLLYLAATQGEIIQRLRNEIEDLKQAIDRLFKTDRLLLNLL